MSLGFLWKNLKLDVLIVQCYAPGHSRFNPIERSWSQLTNWLVGVTLPDDLSGRIPKDNDAEGLGSGAGSVGNFGIQEIRRISHNCGRIPFNE